MGNLSKRIGGTVLVVWALGGGFSAYAATYVPKASKAPIIPSASCEYLENALWGAEIVAQGTQVFSAGGDISSLGFLNGAATDPRTLYEKVEASRKALNLLKQDMSTFMRTREFAARMNSTYERRFFRTYLQRADFLEAAVGALARNLGRTLSAEAAGYGQLYKVQPFNAQGDKVFHSMNVLSRQLANVLTPAAKGCNG